MGIDAACDAAGVSQGHDNRLSFLARMFGRYVQVVPTDAGRAVGGGCDVDAELAANGPLIAAAPDLLAACRAVKADMTLLQFTDGRYIMDEFSAKSIMRLLGQAIAKAEGGA